MSSTSIAASAGRSKTPRDFSAWLAGRRVDTLFVAGCTTSGCDRATVIDSRSHNFRTIVVSDCVGDRATGPHEANLVDMRQKYADLMTQAEIGNI